MQTSPDIYNQVIKGLQEIDGVLQSRREAEKGAWLEVAKQAQGFDPQIAIVEQPFGIDRVFEA
jgi:hypothetical protein